MLLAARIKMRCPAKCLTMAERFPDTTSDLGALPFCKSTAPLANAILATSPWVDPSNGMSSRRPFVGGQTVKHTSAIPTARIWNVRRDWAGSNRIQLKYSAIVNAIFERTASGCIKCANECWVRFSTVTKPFPIRVIDLADLAPVSPDGVVSVNVV